MPSPTYELHNAAHSGSVERTLALLSSGSSIDIDQGCGDKGRTPLMLAADAGCLGVVRALLREGAGVSVADSDGHTALHRSVGSRRLAVSKALIKAGANLEAGANFFAAEAEPVRGYTPLHVAARKGFHKVMVVLIDAGANVDSCLHNGSTPLYLSACCGRLEAVRVLLRAKANPLLATGVHCPLDVAAQEGYLEVVHELVQRLGIDGCASDGGVEALEAAAHHNHADIVAFLCNAGVVDTEGMALCAAVEGRGEACVKLLLQRRGGNANTSTRAYVNIARSLSPVYYDGTQKSPLVCAFTLGRFSSPRIARLLVDAGADTLSDVPYVCDKGRELSATPLMIATSYLRDWETNTEVADGLKGVIRLLQQVDAVHAVSWLWPSDVPFIGRATKGKSRKKSTSIVRMLPVLKRRARRPRVLLAAMSRSNDKLDGPFLGYMADENTRA